MAMQFNKPKFNWEAKDHLSELEQFKQECSVLFQGPLSKMKDSQKAGLIVNWIGRQCIMTLHSMGVEVKSPKTVFDNLEKIFRLESNQTLSRFMFRGLKQKQGQRCDTYMSKLRLAIVECRYPEHVQDELLKDQYIFGLSIKEIQDHLLGEILVEDTPEKCLFESRKIESKIEQRNLLGLKTSRTYDAIQNHRGRQESCGKSQSRGRSNSTIWNCKYCGKTHNKGNCPAYGKKCQKCGCDNHFKAVCKSGSQNEGSPKRDHSKQRFKKGKGKKFDEVSKANEGAMDDLTEQVQSLFYNDVWFNAINTRMHTNVECETPDGKCSENTFKIDTGADGNLMPISMFTKLFSHVSLNALKRMIDKSVMLYVYNNTQIKQYGTCNVKLCFKGRITIGKIFVVEHENAIIRLHDAEKLGLIRVNFNLDEEEKIKIKIIDEVKGSQEFKNQIEEKYPELFKSIELMKGEINIKLKDSAVPHIDPVRRVPHVMQKPLKNELDKLVKEEILHKVDISEPIEWLNSFMCVKKPNGKLRLFLDPTHLNKWIIRLRHSAKLVDDVLHKLNGAKWFTVVNSTSSFFNHKLDTESSKLTTFGTPFRRYRFLRMPMGASLSSDIYQYNVDGHLEGIKNCIAITDDIIIFGFNESGSDHKRTVLEVTDKARSVGMRFNPAKCEFKQRQVKFFGLNLAHDGSGP